MAINLYVKVGRAVPQCIGTFPDSLSADGAQAAKSAELRNSGHAPERVEFSRSEVSQPKKGKK